MPQELSGNNSNLQVPIHDELDEIYRNQTDSSTQTERAISLHSAKVYKISQKINEARSYKLDTQFFTHKEEQNRFIGAVAMIFNGNLPVHRLEPLTEDMLRVQESELGATIFGPMEPNETQREFCYIRRNKERDSWIFYQKKNIMNGKPQEVTLHYEVHPSGILRLSSNPNTPNEFIKDEELDNFLSAAQIYHDLVMSRIYNNDLYSSKKAA